MTDAAILNGRPPGERRPATPALLDLLLAELGSTFDRWVVLNAVVAGSFPAEVGALVPALSTALDVRVETVLSVLDDAEAAHHVRVVAER